MKRNSRKQISALEPFLGSGNDPDGFFSKKINDEIGKYY